MSLRLATAIVKVMLNAKSVGLHTGVTVMAVRGYVAIFVTAGTIWCVLMFYLMKYLIDLYVWNVCS